MCAMRMSAALVRATCGGKCHIEAEEGMHKVRPFFLRSNTLTTLMTFGRDVARSATLCKP